MNAKNTINPKSYLLIFFILVSLNLFAQSKLNKVDFSKFDNYITKVFDEWKIPGMAIAIVQGDSIAFAKGYGVQHFDKKNKVDTKTLFAVASNTKAFTAAGISILVDEGKIKWNDKVIDYLPYFRMYDPYVTANMTIRDLLCHRSGLETFSGDLLWYESNYSAVEVIKRARFLKPKYGFREHFGYSNIMFSVAGQVITAVTGKEWKDYITEKFLLPLEMNKTLTSVKQLKDKKNVAMPHHTGLYTKPIILGYMQWDNVAPAAAIISNVEDMSKWLIMQMNSGKYKGKQILSEKQLWEMHYPQTIESYPKWWTRFLPTKHISAYGLGWEIFDYHGVKVVHHGGGADGMVSKTMFVPEKKIGMVILTNNINYLYTALMYKVLDLYLSDSQFDWSDFYYSFYKRNEKINHESKAKREKQRVKNTKPALDLKEYTGTYGGDMYGDAKVTLQNGKLVVNFIPTPKFVGDLTHWQYETFNIKLRNSPTLPEGTVNFIINSEGKVSEMKIDIPNPDFDFTELKFLKK